MILCPFRSHRIVALLDELDWLRAFCSLLLRDSAAAEDLCQTTLLAALQSPLPPARPLRPWLAAVARNHARRWRRVQASRAAASLEALPEQPAEALEGGADAAPGPEELLAGSTPVNREALALRYLEGLSTLEIAQRLGRPVATIRSRLKRGLAELRRQHRRDGPSWDRV